jgi:phosphate transport system protein
MPEKHSTAQFDSELDDLRARVLEMGLLAGNQLKLAVYALTQFSPDVASQVLIDERRLNTLEVELDKEASLIIARRQPTARDLRLLVAVSKTGANLERIGDEAARIARTVQRLVSSGVSTRMRQPAADLSYAAELASTQLRQTLESFRSMDPKQAFEVIKQDNMIDMEFEGFLRKLVTYMMEDPRTISASIDFVFVAKAIERIGDHAKNVAEQVIYIVTGTDVRHVPMGDVETAVA